MDERLYTRLADVPVPRRMWWWVLLLLALWRQDRKTAREGKRIGEELGSSVVRRWQDIDEASATMVDLTQTMIRLTWAVVALTVIVIAATLYLGLR